MVRCWYCEWYHFHRLSNLRNRKILDRRMEQWFEQYQRKQRWLHWLLLRLSRDGNYIILIMLRNINITVPRFYDANHGKFIILICLDLFLTGISCVTKLSAKYSAEPWIILPRSLRGHPSKKTLITVLTPISWSYFVTRASTYDLIPCHTSGEHEQTSIMTTTSRSHFGGGSSLQSQVQSWFLISALHSSSGGQYGGSAGSKERWVRWNWGEICVGDRIRVGDQGRQGFKLWPVKCRF